MMDKLHEWWQTAQTVYYALGWVFGLAAVVMFAACVVVVAAVVADHRADKASAAEGRKRAGRYPARTLPGTADHARAEKVAR